MFSFSLVRFSKLHRKYHHGEYLDLDNLKEENEEENSREYLNDQQEMTKQKKPLLATNRFNETTHGQSEDDHDDEDGDRTARLESYHESLKMPHSASLTLKL